MKKTLALLVILGLSGCRVAPDREAPTIAVSEQWLSNGSSQEAPRKQWWRQLKDPQLNALIQRARENNLDVDSAHSRISEAQAQRRSSMSFLLPGFDFEGGYTREQASLFAPGGTAGLAAAGIAALTQNIYELGFFAAWELDIFGQRTATLRGSDAQLRAAKADLEDVLLVISAEVASTYLALQGDRMLLRETEEGIASLKAKRTLEQQREQSGLTGEGATLELDAQVLAAEAAIPPLQEQIRTQAYRLAVLLGETPEATLNTVLKFEIPEQRPLPPVHVGVRSELLRRRPDVRAAEERLRAAFYFDEASLAALFPKLNLTGAWGYQSTELRTFLRGESDQYRFGAAVQQPIWHAGRLRAERDGAVARTEQARANYEAAALRALEETENLLATYNGAEKAEALQRQAAGAATRATERANKLVQAGLLDEQTGFDSAYTQSQQRQSLIQRETQRLLTWVSLQRALAGELE